MQEVKMEDSKLLPLLDDALKLEWRINTDAYNVEPIHHIIPPRYDRRNTWVGIFTRITVKGDKVKKYEKYGVKPNEKGKVTFSFPHWFEKEVEFDKRYSSIGGFYSSWADYLWSFMPRI